MTDLCSAACEAAGRVGFQWGVLAGLVGAVLLGVVAACLAALHAGWVLRNLDNKRRNL